MNANTERIRGKMLERFAAMLRPVRIIMDMTRKDFADVSGLSEDIIADIEEGRKELSRAEYLPLAAMVDNAKFTEDMNIYRAMIRILTPEGMFSSEDTSADFILVRRWFDCMKEESTYDDYDEQDITDRYSDNDLERFAAGYEIFADDSAARDENFPALMTRLEPLLRSARAYVSIPEAAIDKINMDMETCADDDEELNISQALEHVHRRQKEELIRLRPSSNEDIDEDLAEVFGQSGGTHKFLLITQEPGRAEALTSDNPHVTAARLDDTGDLTAW